MGFKMKGSPVKKGTIYGTSAYKSALKQIVETLTDTKGNVTVVEDDEMTKEEIFGPKEETGPIKKTSFSIKGKNVSKLEYIKHLRSKGRDDLADKWEKKK
tara:strand:- start:1 stop:300 length:300 start_codon:yes stop_codon:yes gene_type:complete